MLLSVAINARLGFLYGPTPTDGWLVGVGLGIAQILKALAPFLMAWAWYRKDRLAFSAGVVMFIAITAGSLYHSVGFVVGNGAIGSAERWTVALLIGVALELASGLELFVSMRPWRHEIPEPRRAEPLMQQELGLVDMYAAARIDREDGRRMALAELVADYRAWCLRENRVPLNEVEFAKSFDAIAAEIGIVRRQTTQGPAFDDVGFVAAVGK